MNFTWARAGEAERARRQASVAERGRYEVMVLEPLLAGVGGRGEGFLPVTYFSSNYSNSGDPVTQ